MGQGLFVKVSALESRVEKSLRTQQNKLAHVPWKGDDTNVMSKDQISILEKGVEEMIAQRMVSDVDEQDKIASESGSTSTLRGSSPAIEAPESPIYDVPGRTPPIEDWQIMLFGSLHFLKYGSCYTNMSSLILAT